MVMCVPNEPCVLSVPCVSYIPVFFTAGLGTEDCRLKPLCAGDVHSAIVIQVVIITVLLLLLLLLLPINTGIDASIEHFHCVCELDCNMCNRVGILVLLLNVRAM